MSDVTPNYDLEKQRLELEKAQLLLNVQSQQFRIAQTEDEVLRINDNITATQKAITDLDQQINKLKDK